MVEQFVELADRGVTLCMQRQGEGPALLVITGSGSDLRNEPNALKWPIADDFDLLTYDHRGLGRSVQSDPEYQPTMKDFAADALALLDNQGIQEFSVLGISFGGMVAQELAILAGVRITKLVLCCTSSGGEGRSSYPLHELYERGQTTADIFGLWDVRAQYDRPVAEHVLKIFGGKDTGLEPTPGLLKQFAARAGHDTWHRLGLILCPTMVAHGIYDGVAEPTNSQLLAEQIPRAELRPFNGGHHFMWQDRTAWPTMIDFLTT